MDALKLAGPVLFLSTLSLRRATAVTTLGAGSVRDFYPRSPCGERLYGNQLQKSHHLYFYPRSPCGERPPSVFLHCTTYLFLSTLSLRRATILPPADTSSVSISIHALLAESDKNSPALISNNQNISIHALLAESDMYFLSNIRRLLEISIHALLAESDRGNSIFWRPVLHFYPRSPCGERQMLLYAKAPIN